MNTYEDDRGYVHTTEETFGVDGQGSLYTTKNRGILLRLFDAEWDVKPILEECKLLPLDRVDRLIRPSAFLSTPPTTLNGCIFTVPEDFVSLRAMLDKDPNENTREFYTRTGGLKRRLNIAMYIARILLQLHSLPVMYGSIAPERILVSSDPKNAEAFLLYSTGLSYSMNFAGRNDKDPYTAPETAVGQSSTIASDVSAFALMAYDLLTLRGEIPLENDALQQLFDNAAQDTAVRPKLSAFYKAFSAWDDSLCICATCKADISPASSCGQCGAEATRFIKAVIYDRLEHGELHRYTKFFPFGKEIQHFNTSHTGNLLFHEAPERAIDFVLNVSPDKKLRLIFKNIQKKTITIDGKPIAENQSFVVALPKDVIEMAVPMHPQATRRIDITISQ